MNPRCCLSTPRTCFCLGHSVCINITLIQHTQAVHARDALAVSQQIAAIQPRGKQELLPGLPADFAMVHGYRVHGLVDSWAAEAWDSGGQMPLLLQPGPESAT